MKIKRVPISWCIMAKGIGKMVVGFFNLMVERGDMKDLKVHGLSF